MENTLICNSDRGEFIEVTPDKEVVWKYISPVTSDGIIEQGTITTDSLGNWIPHNQVFRCYKYGKDYAGFNGKELSVGEPLKIYEDVNKINAFTLYDNYSNPFNPTTKIEFSLEKREFVSLTVFDIVGNKIRTLTNQVMEPGTRTIIWDSLDKNNIPVGTGVYLYTLEVGNRKSTKKMILLR